MRKILSVSFVASMLLLSSCVTDEQSSISQLRIGLAIDDNNPNASVTNENFRLSLQEHIGMPVTIIEDVTYLVAIEAMRAGNLDIMMASAFNYVMARDVVDVELLASIQLAGEGNNTSFITRADNPNIHSLEDLQGTSFAFVDAASTSGALFPKYELINMFDINPNLIMHSGHFFRTAVYSGSHNASIMGVYFGDFDAAAVATLVINNMENAGAITQDSIRIIAYTDDFPDPTYIARSAIGEDLIASLQEFFLTYDNSDFFYNAWNNPYLRFTPPNQDAFDGVVSLANTLGLNFGG